MLSEREWKNAEEAMNVLRKTATTERERFFHPPLELTAPLTPTQQEELDETRRILKWTKKEEPDSPLWQRCLQEECRASSAIEDESRKEMLEDHEKALSRSLREKPSRKSLLRMHSTLAGRLPHAQAGQYRTVNVRVGNHRGAEYREVPKLMTGLFHYLEKSEDDPVIKAAWGHIQFETIHPFADGNGRTGRGLISQVLGFPLPLSEWIVERRWDYYAALSQGNWEEYLRWVLEGMREQGRRYRPAPEASSKKS